MTKKQFIGNIILFIPFLVINFFAYGIDGCIRQFQMMKEYSKKYLG